LLAATVHWIAIIFAILMSFAAIFYLGPSVRQHWEWITPGSLIGTSIVLIASLLFRVYVQSFSNFDKAYGSLGGVMIMLMWIWIMGIIVLVAAELNAVIREAAQQSLRADPIQPPESKAHATAT
jgi:membrane protein